MKFEEYDKILAEKPGWKVYRYTFPNGKVYIGKTYRKMSERQHNKEWDGYKGCPAVYNAIKKYGVENIVTNILFYGFMDEQKCSEREKQMIAHHRSNQIEYGYNLTYGGEGTCGYRFSEEARKKIGEARRGKKNHNYGKRRSEETRSKISESLKGRIITDEMRLEISKSLRGRHISDETRKKISEAKKGKPAHNRKAVMCIETGTIYVSACDAAEAIGKRGCTVSDACKGRIHTAGGCHWKYVKEE